MADRGHEEAHKVTSFEAGLAIGFGPVFLAGVAADVLILAGEIPGANFAQALLWSQIVTIGALSAVVMLWERSPMATLGLYRPSRLDIEYGLGLFLLLLILQIAAGTVLQFLRGTAAPSALFFHVPLPAHFIFALQASAPLAVVLVIVTVAAEELVVRGYAFDRLRNLTHSTAIAAGTALLLDMVAHAPLWGLQYTICFIPAEIVLMWLYVSERRLLPCFVGHAVLTWRFSCPLSSVFCNSAPARQQ